MFIHVKTKALCIQYGRVSQCLQLRNQKGATKKRKIYIVPRGGTEAIQIWGLRCPRNSSCEGTKLRSKFFMKNFHLGDGVGS